MCFRSGVVGGHSSAVLAESLWRQFRVSSDRTSILIYRLDLYLKSVPHKPGVFSRLLGYVGDFFNGQVGSIKVDGSL